MSPLATVAAVATGSPSTYPTYAAKRSHTQFWSNTSLNQAMGTWKQTEPMPRKSSPVRESRTRRTSISGSRRVGGRSFSVTMPGNPTVRRRPYRSNTCLRRRCALGASQSSHTQNDHSRPRVLNCSEGKRIDRASSASVSTGPDRNAALNI